MSYEAGKSQRIRIPKTAEIVASRIRKSIISGELRTGDVLPREAELISTFEVSRSTVREAIRILEAEGLIDPGKTARGGAKVTSPTPDVVARSAGLALQSRNATIGDVYTARTLLEPPAARLAAEGRSGEAAEALRRHVRYEYEVDADPVKRAAAIADFHRILLEECGNVTMAIIGQALQRVVERHFVLAYRVQPPRRHTRHPSERLGYRSHERLIELIEAGDGPAAEAHWQRHMQNTAEFWLGGIGEMSVVEILE